MATTIIQSSTVSHVLTIVSSLIQSGWTIENTPAQGKLPRNGLLLSLSSDSGITKLRVFIFKITGSSRSRDTERRIEITTTYKKSLSKMRTFQDVVLGFDPANDIFVGVDPLRLHEGGPTGNASSFIDLDGLLWKNTGHILIRPRATKLQVSKIEYQAYIKPSCLGDYLLNSQLIHSGSYDGQSLYTSKYRKISNRYHSIKLENPIKDNSDTLSLCAPKMQPIKQQEFMNAEELVEGLSSKRPKRKITPIEYRNILKCCEEHGQIGERYVYDYERKWLVKHRKPNLALKVKWVSQASVGEGYDILSFDQSGVSKYIEVKSSKSNKYSFQMSENEWQTAIKYKDKYWVYRILGVPSDPVIFKKLCNPVALERDGLIRRTPDGYIVKIR